MTGRIVLYGATGYTGRLTAAALVQGGLRPVLAGRGGQRLAQLADELGGLETVVADAGDPPSLRKVLQRGDVLVTTVGPFIRLGAAAVQAACDVGAVYLDSTGEPPFIREVFAEHGPRAEVNGAALLTAFGYDYVPGNLAGALALSRAGDAAVRAEIGYFVHGGGIIGAASGGTAASALGVLFTSSHRFTGGRLVLERAAKHVRAFRVDGAARQGVSLGGSEHWRCPASPRNCARSGATSAGRAGRRGWRKRGWAGGPRCATCPAASVLSPPGSVGSGRRAPPAGRMRPPGRVPALLLSLKPSTRAGRCCATSCSGAGTPMTSPPDSRLGCRPRRRG